MWLAGTRGSVLISYMQIGRKVRALISEVLNLIEIETHRIGRIGFNEFKLQWNGDPNCGSDGSVPVHVPDT